MTTIMSEALLKLHAWLSPGYPVGAFSYSHGLERAIADGAVTTGGELEVWVEDCLQRGAGRSDAILLSHAWRAPEDDAVDALARALSPSAERLLEAEAQGAAFSQVTGAAWGKAQAPASYPVAVGRAAALHGVGLNETLTVFLQAYAANLISAAVRLVPLGQTEGQTVLANLSLVISDLVGEAATEPLDEIGSCTIAADIASMRHETQEVRLFRS